MSTKVEELFNKIQSTLKLNQTDKTIKGVGVEDLNTDVNVQSFINAVGLEDLDDTQKDVLQKALYVGSNPNEFTGREIKPDQDAITPETIGSLDVEYSIGTESFDGEALDSLVAVTTTFNALASKADELTSTFFPTIVIDPNVANYKVTSTIENFVLPVTHGASTTLADRQAIPVVKATNSINSPINVDANRLYPVYRDSVQDYFLVDYKRVVNVGAAKITTAPLKVGGDVNLLGLAQTDNQLAKGVMDDTDSLAGRVIVDKLYLQIKKDDKTEVFKFDTSILPFNNFTYSTQDHTKDIVLNFKTDALKLSSAMKKILPNGAVADSEILAELGAGVSAKVQLIIHGDGNTQGGNIAIYPSAIRLVGVYSETGEELPTDSDVYVTAKTIVDGLSVIGFEVEAYARNTNDRFFGQLIDVDEKSQLYTVAYTTGITVKLPKGDTGPDSIAKYISGQINAAKAKATLKGVETLMNYADRLRTAQENGQDISEINVSGIGRFKVNPYYENITIDLETTVDSRVSTDRQENIKAAIANKLKDAILRMITDSNYQIARGGDKILVIIGAGRKVYPYIPTDLDLPDGIDVKVVTNTIKDIENKVYISLSSEQAQKGKFDDLSFGNLLWSPELAYKANRIVNGVEVQVLTTKPRLQHIVNLPILVEVDVTNLDKVLGKVAAYRKSV